MWSTKTRKRQSKPTLKHHEREEETFREKNIREFLKVEVERTLRMLGKSSTILKTGATYI
jgi:hypothetical protein